MLTPQANKSQLTIFYGGSVCVYDAIPPEKVNHIITQSSLSFSVNPKLKHCYHPFNLLYSFATIRRKQ
jgi:tify domain